ncbi:hypothetical protein BAUCODRAFT_45138, partial [Baudoinia panamericana UAMH 10762]
PGMTCAHCQHPCSQYVTRRDNPNGNAGRPYFICHNCNNSWSTWNDTRGISPSNPPCNCGVPSRQGKSGVGAAWEGYGFWVCAKGSCQY